MNIGLHIRLHKTISAVAHKALRLKLPYFQTFVLNTHGHFFTPTAQDKKNFLMLRKNFGPLFLHSSYWINCASNSRNVDHLLKQELELARTLAFDFYILHPGAAPTTRTHRLRVLTQRLGEMSKRYPDIYILLENVAHAHNTIGGALEELGKIAQILGNCPTIGFCIDTAHAHSYGYNLNTPTAVDSFIKHINQQIGLERVKLIHLNNTTQVRGSHIDAHCITTKGTIALDGLKHLVHAPELKHKYFITELPPLTQEKEKAILTIIKAWHIKEDL